MRQTREEEYRPEVIIDFDADPRHTDILCFVVQNIGRRPARHVRFSFEPDPVNWRGVNISKTGAFESGLHFLSPRRTLRWRYESFSILVNNPDKPKRFTVIIDYQDIKAHGKRQKICNFQESFILDANQFRDQYVISKSADKSLDRISQMVEKVGSELGQLRQNFYDANYQAIRNGNEEYYEDLDKET